MLTFRGHGPLGALLDEYEKAIEELIVVIKDLDQEALTKIRDKETKDPDCRSIETILEHLINAGYGYIQFIESLFGNDVPRKKGLFVDVASAIDGIRTMFAQTEQMIMAKTHLDLSNPVWMARKKVSWGPTFDFEQMMEHAIVHILRHRRQIQKFLSI